jgi:calcineurin-like phosphoesterase
VLVINAQGRVFMDPVDDPFRAVEAAVAAAPLAEQADAIIVDFHTEATSEIQAMGFFLDGKVSLVVGTHTHIPTSDHRILKGGTALMADAGMCGDYDSSSASRWTSRSTVSSPASRRAASRRPKARRR